MSDLIDRTENLQPTCNQLATDLISRQAAVDALADYIHNVDKVYSTGHLSTADCEDAARSVIEEVPSAQPELIRCKDCEYYFTKWAPWKCTRYGVPRSPEDFCSRAERRTDDSR